VLLDFVSTTGVHTVAVRVTEVLALPARRAERRADLASIARAQRV
jgi:hypothetical protein